jgi:hypothetical protein
MTRPASVARRTTLLGAMIVLVLASCGIPAEDRVTLLNNNDLGADLVNTTTTSTTTTTIPAPPTTTLPIDPGIELTTTSTTIVEPVVDLQPTDVFYVVGFADELKKVTIGLIPEVTVVDLVDALEQLPQQVADQNLRTELRPDLVVGVDLEDGIATVDLSEDVLDSIPSSRQRRANAQIVLTFTSFVTSERGAIGSDRFTSDGEPISVFLPAEGGDSEAGEAVSFEDFAILIDPGGPPGATSTTVADSSPSTVPSTTP